MWRWLPRTLFLHNTYCVNPLAIIEALLLSILDARDDFIYSYMAFTLLFFQYLMYQFMHVFLAYVQVTSFPVFIWSMVISRSLYSAGFIFIFFLVFLQIMLNLHLLLFSCITRTSLCANFYPFYYYYYLVWFVL